MGPPDFLAIDQGSAYVSREMKASGEASGITLEEALIVSPVRVLQIVSVTD